MGSYAQITIVGNVGGDPEFRRTNNGELCTFSLAVNRKRGNEEFTDWYRCISFFDRQNEFIEKYVKKGSHIIIGGEPAHNKWEDNDGNERTTFEVRIERLQLDDPKPDGAGNGRDADRGARDRGRDRDDRGRAGTGRDDRSGGRDDRSSARAGGRDARDDQGRGRDERGRGRDDRSRDDQAGGRGGGKSKQYNDDIDDEIPF